MQYRDVTFTFPEEATDSDRLVIALQSPYSFVRWCRTRVGKAPNCFSARGHGCVLETYFFDVCAVRCIVTPDRVIPAALEQRGVLSPTWIQRVVRFVDFDTATATYNDVANMLMLALERNELA